MQRKNKKSAKVFKVCADKDCRGKMCRIDGAKIFREIFREIGVFSLRQEAVLWE